MNISLLMLLGVFRLGLALWDSECELNSGEKCDGSLDLFEVQSNKICPFPVSVGSRVSFFWSGTFLSTQNVTGLEVKIYYRTQLMKKITDELEESFAENEYANFEYHYDIPSYAPSGKYTVIGGLLNEDDELINCWKTQISLSK